MKNKRAFVRNNGMAGVGSPLEANDDIGILGQEINDLAFAFIAPLGSNHNEICHNLI